MILCNYKFVNASVKAEGAAESGGSLQFGRDTNNPPIHSSLLMLSTMCGPEASSSVLCAFNYSAKMVLSLMVILCLLSILAVRYALLLLRSTTKRVIRHKS